MSRGFCAYCGKNTPESASMCPICVKLADSGWWFPFLWLVFCVLAAAEVICA